MALLISGSSNTVLSKKIAQILNVPLTPIQQTYFCDGETEFVIPQNISGEKIFIIQSIARMPNDLLIETCLLADTLHRNGASEICLVTPYLAYSRQSTEQVPGSSVAARLIADFFYRSGVTKLITCDLHQEHVASFFNFSIRHLTATPLFIYTLLSTLKIDRSKFVVVGPDLGSAKRTARFANALDVPFALIDKRRLEARSVKSLSLIGEVGGKDVLLADDVCQTANTLASAAKLCREKGAKHIWAMVTHGMFSDTALQQIEESPIDLLFVTDSIPIIDEVKASPKIHVLSLASMLAEEIRSAF